MYYWPKSEIYEYLLFYDVLQTSRVHGKNFTELTLKKKCQKCAYNQINKLIHLFNMDQ